MTTEWLAPQPMLQFTDASGNFLAGGKLFTYAAGTTTKLATYVDNTGSTPNANPIILNPNGTASIWIPPGIGYKFVLAPANDTDPPSAPIWTADQIFIAPVLPTPSSGNELYFSRVNAAGTAYEVVSPATVLAAIGAAPASGSPNYAPIAAFGGIINSNTSLNLTSNNTTYEVGVGSSAPFTITLPTPNANTRFTLIGTGGSYAASVNTASGSLILPDGTTATLPFAAPFNSLGARFDFFADGTQWITTATNGQPIARAAVLANQPVTLGQMPSVLGSTPQFSFPVSPGNSSALSMIIGTFTAAANGSGTVTIANGGFPTACAAVFCQTGNSPGTNNAFDAAPASKTTFTWNWPSTATGSFTVYYMAIGY